jgi:hypothetical protein
MKRKKEQELITTFTDGIGDPGTDIPPDNLAARVAAHKKLSHLLRDAYDTRLPDEKLAYLGTRVVSRARASQEPDILERLAKLWYTIFRHPFLALGTTMCVLVLCVGTVILVHTNHTAEPIRMESFVIHQTADGNGFVRYFKYYKVDNDGNKISL